MYVQDEKDNNRRVDLAVFGKNFSFREWENSQNNPISIFEFKRQWREDFISNSKEDPVDQVISYLDRIRAKKYKINKWLEYLEVWPNTPAFWYIICSFTPSVEERFKKRKQFKQSEKKWVLYNYNEEMKFYIQAIDRVTLLNDAKLRNKIFFDKLWISDEDIKENLI
jgi:hypothetical protein